jgi:hypothetical protein
MVEAMAEAQRHGIDPQTVVTAGANASYTRAVNEQAKGAVEGLAVVAAPVAAAELGTAAVAAVGAKGLAAVGVTAVTDAAVFGGTAAVRTAATNAIDGKPLSQGVADAAVKEGATAAAGGVLLRAAGNLAKVEAAAPEVKATPEVSPTTSAAEVRGGRYGHLEDGPFVGSGKDFTATQKRNVLAENQKLNGGVLRDDRTGELGVAPQQSQKGVTPPENEVHVDHWYPKSEGGPNSYSNAEVRLRKHNLKKSDKLPDDD